jgi:hypothetical protein
MPDDLGEAMRRLAVAADDSAAPVTATEAMTRSPRADPDGPRPVDPGEVHLVAVGGARRAPAWWARAAIAVPVLGALVASGLWWQRTERATGVVAAEPAPAWQLADCAVYLRLRAGSEAEQRVRSVIEGRTGVVAVQVDGLDVQLLEVRDVLGPAAMESIGPDGLALRIAVWLEDGADPVVFRSRLLEESSVDNVLCPPGPVLETFSGVDPSQVMADGRLVPDVDRSSPATTVGRGPDG